MKTKLSFTLDESVIAAVRKFAQDDARPISVSNAIDMLLKEALRARGIYMTPDNVMDLIVANPPFDAGKGKTKRKRP